MKKAFAILIASLLIFTGCNKRKPEENKTEDNIKVEDEKKEETKEELKDRYGNEFKNGKIVFSSEDLQELTLDFLTNFSMADEKMLDDLYLDENKKAGFKKLLESESGKELVTKVADSLELVSTGISDAVFDKSTFDKDGNSFIAENGSNINIVGPNYRHFIEVLKLKREEPMIDDKEILEYLDRFVKYYPAKTNEENAVSFCYVNGKPMIDGLSFINFVGIFADIDGNLNSAVDLVKNGFTKSAEPDADLKPVLEEIKMGEFINAYELLKAKKVQSNWGFDPSSTMKMLYGSTDDVRERFLTNMRKLPKPLVKTYMEDGEKKTMVIYYYKDFYSANVTGITVEDIFTCTGIEDFSGVMFENVVQNTLLME